MIPHGRQIPHRSKFLVGGHDPPTATRLPVAYAQPLAPGELFFISSGSLLVPNGLLSVGPRPGSPRRPPTSPSPPYLVLLRLPPHRRHPASPPPTPFSSYLTVVLPACFEAQSQEITEIQDSSKIP